ncbi:MAG: DNA methyltransferase [Phycisphaerae bacterium]
MPKKRPSKPARSPKPKRRSPKPADQSFARRDFLPAAPKRKSSSLLDTRVIFCGDNLDKLKDFPDASVDLTYLDPPFNSNRNYEVFWGETREKRSFKDRHASTQAYIDFMRPRCVELARVLKKTGSFYYHCDWHASHYVKVMLDQIFGENNFVNEIIWKRQTAHSNARKFGVVTESLLFYTNGGDYTWNGPTQKPDEEYIKAYYKYRDSDGRVFQSADLVGHRGVNPEYEWRGIKRPWRFPKERLEELDKAGKIFWTKNDFPRLKRYLDEAGDMPVQNLWLDIKPVVSWSHEKLGYPTQKPLALLERIINASSNPGDIVLDAFCGCGTALVAAENLGRQWIGIDVSPTACRVMAKRLRDVCGIEQNEALWKAGRGFVVRDLPKTIEELRKYPPFEFENWAVLAIGGIPNKTKVGDMGIDGRIFPVSAMPKKSGKAAGELDFMDVWYPIQVKQKDKVGRPDIDSFEAAMIRADRTKGFFVAFDYSSDALTEIDAFFRRSHKAIIPLTVKEILDEEIAKKLA